MPRSSYLVTPTLAPYTQSVQIVNRPAWMITLVLAIVGGIVLLASGCAISCATGAGVQRLMSGGTVSAVTAPSATTTAAGAAVVRTPSASASSAAPIVSVPSRIDVYHHGMASPRSSAAPSPDSAEERWRQYRERRLRERDER